MLGQVGYRIKTGNGPDAKLGSKSARSGKRVFLIHLIKQCFGFDQVGGVEAFGEPIVRGQQFVVSLISSALVIPKPGEDSSCAKFVTAGRAQPGILDRSFQGLLRLIESLPAASDMRNSENAVQLS